MGKLFSRFVRLSLLTSIGVMPVFLMSCDSQQAQPKSHDSAMTFKLPRAISDSRTINQQQVSARIQANNTEVVLSKNGDSFSGAMNIQSGTELSYILQILEQVGPRQVVLATLSETRLITNDTSITLTENQYTYPDNDSDGFNNLLEREAGSDYANSNSTPNNIEGTAPQPSIRPGVLQYSRPDYSVSEADGALTVSVTRTAGSDGAISVRYRLNNETATAGEDFQSTSGTLNWADGDNSPKSFDIQILGDDKFEGEQTFTAHLFSATGGSAVGNGFARIVLQDSTLPPQRGTLQFSTSNLQVSEEQGTVTVTIERTGGSDGLVTVDYSTTDGTAEGGLDYRAIPNPLTLAWADGDADPREITVQILTDDLIETAESFQFVLSSIRGGATLGTATAAVTITDSTPPPPPPPVVQNGSVSIASQSYIVNEGSGIDIPVERRVGTDGAATVGYRLVAGSADTNDFTVATRQT